MPFTIEDGPTAELIAQLAEATDVTEAEAVRHAVRDALCRVQPDARPLRVRLAELRRRYPLPEPTGLKADKAFFDALSGDLS